MSLDKPQSAWLVPLSGPAMEPIELVPSAGGIVIGRHEDCDIKVPVEADKVSRFHARLTLADGRWRITDLNSRWGTFVNGVRLTDGHAALLSEGDLIRITPWTLAFSRTRAELRGQQLADDAPQMQTLVRSVSPEAPRAPLADDLLTLLLELAAAIHAAADEQALAQTLLEAAALGTGLPNAALLRPLDAGGRIEVIATRAGGAQTGAIYSRSLIQAASGGSVAELSGPGEAMAQSIVQLKIDAAICVPLMLGATVAAYLYLDSRGGTGRPLRAGASAFCLALGRIASLALANLKRIDMERRAAMIEAELSAGAEAQRWILPRRDGRFGAFSYIGESRPGRHVGGDFFDVIPLDENRLAVALGDVTGKGIPASVLMTAAQGFLHAALREHGDPERAVTDLNRYVCPRRPESKFITLWLGVFDFGTRTLKYVDAGHGYALLLLPDQTTEALAGGGNVPVGVVDDFSYEAQTAAIAPGGRVLIVSDGIIEQFSDPAQAPVKQQFQLEGVRQAMQEVRSDADAVAALFEAVIRHAGTSALADDATAVIIRWD